MEPMVFMMFARKRKSEFDRHDHAEITYVEHPTPLVFQIWSVFLT